METIIQPSSGSWGFVLIPVKMETPEIDVNKCTILVEKGGSSAGEERVGILGEFPIQKTTSNIKTRHA